MTKRLFHQKHPILIGAIILVSIFVVVWAGTTFFISLFNLDKRDASIFPSPGADGGIGIIEVKGVIVSAEETIKALTNFRKRREIRAIVLRVDSPGGAVGASQEIYKEVKRTDNVKPVIASFGSVAASGGYYASLGARKIFASRGTLTGSIGVILKFANLKEIFDKVGYKTEIVKSGKMKDIGSASRSLTDEERELLKALIGNVHEQFISDIIENRKIPDDKLRKYADGRIFSGQQAMEIGLIDQVGNFTDAVIYAGQTAGMETQTPRLIYPEGKKFSLLKLLTGEQAQLLFKNININYPVLSYEWTLGN